MTKFLYYNVTCACVCVCVCVCVCAWASEAFEKGGDLNSEVNPTTNVYGTKKIKIASAGELMPLQRGLGACLPGKFGFLHCF